LYLEISKYRISVNNYNTIMNRKNDMNHEVLFTSFENQAYEYTTSSMVRGKCYSV